jgi:phosphatidylglycerophosphatase A
LPERAATDIQGAMTLKPSWSRRLPTPAILALATLGPIGRRLPAPGTWGSAAGLVYFAVVFPNLGKTGWLLLTAIGICSAVAICGEAEIRLGRKDPGEVILDEFVAMPLCFLGWPALIHPLPFWAVGVAGFGLFRVLDTLKPLFINNLQRLPGGWGVVADDIGAALAACGILHAAKWIWVIAHAN